MLQAVGEWPLWAVYVALGGGMILLGVLLRLLFKASVIAVLLLVILWISVSTLFGFPLGTAAVVIGMIPAAIAHYKGRNFFGWWLYGTALWIVATPHAIVAEPRERPVKRKK